MISKNDFAQLLKKAEQGIAEAQNRLGILYRDGNGVPRDLHKAVYWFHKAIDQGCMEGQLRFSTSVYFFDFETECGRYYKVWKNTVSGCKKQTKPKTISKITGPQCKERQFTALVNCRSFLYGSWIFSPTKPTDPG